MGSSGDVMSSRLRMVLFYGVPSMAIALTAGLANWNGMTVVWPIAFSVMGFRCVVNALHCGRVHCYFTGPLFLLAAAGSLVHGLRIADLGSWSTIGFGTLTGALLLSFASEKTWGRYFKRRGSGG